jgi:hypothetical protein
MTIYNPDGNDAANLPTFVFDETPSGLINDVNTAYTIANTPTSGTVQLYRNGVLQTVGGGLDYTISGTAITFVEAPASGDILRCAYHY